MLHTVIEWFKNPETLLVAMGPWVLWGTMLIVLIESGVLFPVLPGESLLFTAGLLHDRLGLHLPTLILLVVVAAFIGAQIGYFLGAKWGRRFFKPDARILKTAHLEKAEHYFTNYGGRSLVIGRFIPFVRTSSRSPQAWPATPTRSSWPSTRSVPPCGARASSSSELSWATSPSCTTT